MIKIIGISGSPRSGGNTEFIVKEALNEAKKEGLETEFLSLSGKSIKPCNACLSCKKIGHCIIQDDFEPIFKKMIDADGIILGSPVYFGSATPEIKALMDRAGYISSQTGKRFFENKVGGPLIVARRAGQNFTLAQLLFFFLHQGMIVPGSTYWNISFGREKLHVKNDEEGRMTAKNFSKKMVWILKKLKE
jgi:multimeric flavodoxin WrbA